MEYDVPITEENYDIRKQNYQRNKKVLESRRKEFELEQKKVNLLDLRQLKSLEKEFRIKKRRLTGKYKFLILTICMMIGMILIGASICFLQSSEYVRIIEEMQMEYENKVKAYNEAKRTFEEEQKQRKLEKEAEELKQKKNQLRKEISGEKEIQSVLVNKSNPKAANEYIASLDRHPKLSLEMRTSADGENFYIHTLKYDLNKYYISDSGTDTIYPGAIIKGDSLFKNNLYTLITEKRMPITLTSNANEDFLYEVEEPDYGKILKGIKNLQRNTENKSVTESKYEMKVITSSDELNATLGIAAGNATAKAGIGLGMSTSKETTSIAIIFSQIYYTIAIIPKSNAADYFQDGVSLEKLGSYEPAYVSRVDYGKMVVMLLQAEMSKEKLEGKLNACLNGAEISGGLEKLKNEKEINISYTFYGGDTNHIGDAVDSVEENENGGIYGSIHDFIYGENKETAIDKINAFIQNNNELINPVPISYELKYLSDNSVVPKMSISKFDTFFSEHAKEVKIELSRQPKKSFEINFPSGTLKMDDTTFLWDENLPISLEGEFDGEPFTISLDGSEKGKGSYKIHDGIFNKVYANLYISDVEER